MSVNDRQVGGTHYNQVKVQHWDLMLLNRVPYLEAQITKYITRWRKKDQAVKDVEKSGHYLEKLIDALEEGALFVPTVFMSSILSPRPLTADGTVNLPEFFEQNKVGDIEQTIFRLILTYTTMDELKRVEILLAHLLQMAYEFEGRSPEVVSE